MVDEALCRDCAFFFAHDQHIMPMAFPPALTDIDMKLQRAHLYLTLGMPGSDDAVLKATSAAAG